MALGAEVTTATTIAMKCTERFHILPLRRRQIFSDLLGVTTLTMVAYDSLKRFLRGFGGVNLVVEPNSFTVNSVTDGEYVVGSPHMAPKAFGLDLEIFRYLIRQPPELSGSDSRKQRNNV